MRMRIVALTFGLGIAACGGQESRPAQDPTTTSATTPGPASPVTTTYDTTLPASPRPKAVDTSFTADPSTTTPATTSSSGLATTPGTAPAPGAAVAPSDAHVSNDPGVADQTKNADNTKINDRDRHGAVTPMDQGNSKPELAITASIRKGVMGDKSLSFTAKNVKIITVGTKVTLRGPVSSEAEKAAIETRAKQTAGVTDVDNQIEVKK